MKRVTLYLREDVIQLINHLYALRIINGQKATKGEIVTEALLLLAQNEEHTVS